nr:Fe-S cluster assembly protein HesB [Caloramator mitchellensis]
MALDVPKEGDKVFEVEGVNIILDDEMVEYTPGFIIDYRNTYFGKRFSVDSLYGGGGCS